MNKAFTVLVAVVIVANSAFTFHLWQSRVATQRQLDVLEEQTMDDAALLYALSDLLVNHIVDNPQE